MFCEWLHVYGTEPIVRPLDVLLSLDMDIEEPIIESGHECACCSYPLCREDSDTFGNL